MPVNKHISSEAPGAEIMLLRRAAELHDWLCEGENLSPRTRALYTTVRGLFLAFILSVSEADDPPWSELSPVRVVEFQRWMRKRPGSRRIVKPSTISQYTTCLKAWSSAVHRLVQPSDEDRPDPLHKVRVPKVAKEQPKFLEIEQFDRLVAACVGTDQPLRNMAILHLFGDTGIRVSALCAVRIEELVWIKHADALPRGAAHGTLRVMEKGRVERTFAFGHECRMALERYIRSERSKKTSYTVLFLNRSSAPLRPDAVRTMLRTLQAQSGLENVHAHPHLLRSTFATWQARDGIAPDTLRQQLGHQNMQTTLRYIAPVTDPTRVYSSPLDRRRRRPS